MTGKTAPAGRLRRKQKIKPPEGYLNRKQAADYIHRSIHTLDKYASEGRHFAFKKIGRDTYVKQTDLDEFKKKRQTF